MTLHWQRQVICHTCWLLPIWPKSLINTALTGGGFRDFTRIAAANPELWWRIMRLNRGALSEALDDYSQIWRRW